MGRNRDINDKSEIRQRNIHIEREKYETLNHGCGLNVVFLGGRTAVVHKVIIFQ